MARKIGKIKVYAFIKDKILPQPYRVLDVDGSEDLYLKASKSRVAMEMANAQGDYKGTPSHADDLLFLEKIESCEKRLKVEIHKDVIIIYQYK